MSPSTPTPQLNARQSTTDPTTTPGVDTSRPRIANRELDTAKRKTASLTPLRLSTAIKTDQEQRRENNDWDSGVLDGGLNE